MSAYSGVVAVSSLALEARIARGPGVSIVLCCQAHHLAARLKAAIADGASGIISFGIAGGLAPDLAAGDCIIASAVRVGRELFAADRNWAQSLLAAIPGAIHAEIAGSDAIVAHPEDKRRLHRETGAAAVDMESHIAARVALAHDIPFAACRIVIDAAHRKLPHAATVGLREDGKPDVLRVFHSVLRQPGQLPDLMRTARDSRVARKALHAARKNLGLGLGCPDYAERAVERELEVA